MYCKTCTFFGHRDCPSTITPVLRKILVDLIENYDVNLFYVGNHGTFDRLVCAVLREIIDDYPQIECVTVLAYMPDRNTKSVFETVFPEELASTLPRYAILRRNEWMLHRSDFVVTYITHNRGGAARFAEQARRQKKTVFNLAEML